MAAAAASATTTMTGRIIFRFMRPQRLNPSVPGRQPVAPLEPRHAGNFPMLKGRQSRRNVKRRCPDCRRNETKNLKQRISSGAAMALFRRSIETADDAAADYFLRCVSEERMISAWVLRSRQWRISPLGRLLGLCLPIRALDLALAGAWAFAGVLALAGAWALSGVAAGVAGVATGSSGVAAVWDRAAARSSC